MDVKALFNLSYGMYVISTKDGTRDVGCIANSVIQVSSSPATLAISINKKNFTTSCIQETKKFAVSILSEEVSPNVISTFGFSSGKDKNKFEGIECKTTEAGAVLSHGACAYIECRVINQTECFSHIVFFAEIIDARNLNNGSPMTYDYYHKVIKGKAPKNAPTYIEETSETEKKYTCDVCRYVYSDSPEEFEALPDSFTCPVCGVAKSCFSLK